MASTPSRRRYSPAVDGIEGGGGGSFPGGERFGRTRAAASYNTVFSPSLVGEFRGAYLKVRIAVLRAQLRTQRKPDFGLPNVNIDELTSGLMPVTLTGYAGAGDSNFLPLIQIDNTWQVSDSLTKIMGPQTLKVGGGLINRDFTVYQSNQPLGNMTFNTTLTDNGTGSGGNSIASFLLGYPQQVSRITLVLLSALQHQGTLRLRPGRLARQFVVNVNAGLRYDIFTPYTERDDHLVNVDLAPRRSWSPARTVCPVRRISGPIRQPRAARSVSRRRSRDTSSFAAASVSPITRATTCRSRF